MLTSEVPVFGTIDPTVELFNDEVHGSEREFQKLIAMNFRNGRVSWKKNENRITERYLRHVIGKMVDLKFGKNARNYMKIGFVGYSRKFDYFIFGVVVDGEEMYSGFRPEIEDADFRDNVVIVNKFSENVILNMFPECFVLVDNQMKVPLSKFRSTSKKARRAETIDDMLHPTKTFRPKSEREVVRKNLDSDLSQGNFSVRISSLIGRSAK